MPFIFPMSSDKEKIPEMSWIKWHKDWWMRETREDHQSIIMGHSWPETPHYLMKSFQQASKRSPGAPQPPCTCPMSDHHHQQLIFKPSLWPNHLSQDFPWFTLVHLFSLSAANVNLVNFLSLRPLIYVPCILSLVDTLFLLTGLAAGEAEIFWPRTQSLPGYHLKRLNKPSYFRDLLVSSLGLSLQTSATFTSNVYDMFLWSVNPL